jgi:FtsP/CotA-like multicopper oxidase with cupredoxin domain
VLTPGFWSLSAISRKARTKNMSAPRLFLSACLLVCVVSLLAPRSWAQAPDAADLVCPRLPPGSVATAPTDLSSQNGVLEVTFDVLTAVDDQGLVRYCYVTDTGLESPTLHVSPGDQLIIHLQNQLPASGNAMSGHIMSGHAIKGLGMSAPTKKDDSDTGCTADGTMTSSTTNFHFHGMNIPPVCHQDEVIQTTVQPAETFDYQVQIPPDEPPGLYWYHPHLHGFSTTQVRGGATGALIVDGIESLVPAVAGLTARTLVLRSQLTVTNGTGVPTEDISINYVPVTYPDYLPAQIQTGAGQQEFWRVLNSTADTTFNLEYQIGGVDQSVQLVAVDGVPVGGVTNPQSVPESSIELPPGARAEFVVTTPNVGDTAQLVTESWDSGPDGIWDPSRPIADIVAVSSALAEHKPAPKQLAAKPAKFHLQKSSRFAGLKDVTTFSAERTLYFSENASVGQYFITVDGQTPAVFNMSQAPNLVIQRGAVESWTIENHSTEDHIFHIHQLHFQVLDINGVAVNDPAIRDTILVPYWNGTDPTYPSVTLSMDFRDPNISGTFVYHCHILDHEDLGMMGEIQVVPTPIETTTQLTTSSSTVNMNDSVTVTATVTSVPYSGAAISGTVQFSVDGANSGSPVAIANGQATFTTVFSAAGNHTITAAYSGDSNYQASTAAPLAVTAAGFTVTATSPTVSGATAVAVVTIAPSGGFNGTVNLTCSVPPALATGTCALNPTSITGNGQATLTITSSSSSSSKSRSGAWPSGVMAGLLACVFLMVIPSRRLSSSVRLSVLVIACLLATVSCSSSNSGNSGHETGSYDIVVTAAGKSNGSTIQNAVTVPVTFN